MSQQSAGPCKENQRMCKLFDDAVAEVCRLRSDQEYAKKIGASDAGELQAALARARAAGRAVGRSLQDHVEQHGCKA